MLNYDEQSDGDGWPRLPPRQRGPVLGEPDEVEEEGSHVPSLLLGIMIGAALAWALTPLWP